MPLAETDYTSIIPLGGLNPPSHTFPTHHMYFVLTDIKTFPPPYPVRAPADGFIVRIAYNPRDWPAGSPFTGKFNDYGMTILHSNTFETNFGHISDLDESILKQAGQLKVDQFTNVSIPVKAGDIVGWVGGRPGTQMFCLDFGAVNKEVNLNFIKPERYADIRYAVSPLDYYPDNLKQVFYQKLTRKAEPRGGKIDYDLPGKLSGNWFLEGITSVFGEVEKHLAFVYDKDDPAKILVAIGGTLNIPVGVYEVVGNAPDPSQVSAESAMVTYRLRGGPGGDTNATVIVRVLAGDMIRVEGFAGHVENPQFTADARVYTR